MSVKNDNDKNMEEVMNYQDIFPRAWEMFLKRVKEGEIFIPDNEAELRCHLFSICLSVMQELKLSKPYKIFAEQELWYGRRPD